MEIWGFILLGFMSRHARFTRGMLISASNSAHPLFTTLTSDACAHQSNTSLPLFRTFSTLAFQKYFYLGLMSSHLTVICECELHHNELIMSLDDYTFWNAPFIILSAVVFIMWRKSVSACITQGLRLNKESKGNSLVRMTIGISFVSIPSWSCEKIQTLLIIFQAIIII